MKRTELKRTKPMKRSAIKKKKKPKTALQKRKDKMDSPYWNTKCKAEVTRWAHNMPCLICGKTERNGVMIVGHHLIRKSRSRLHRWHPMNIVALCPLHHLHGIQIAAHSDNVLAVARFVERLRARAPEWFAWLEVHADAARKVETEVKQIARPDWRKQYEMWKLIADKAEEAAQDRR